MMTRFSFIIIILLTMGVASCAVAEQAPAELETVVQNKPVFSSPADSLQVQRITGIIQSSPESILSASTVKIEGKYVLDLTEEDALALGISEDIYKRYCEVLEKLNLQ